VSTHVPRRRLDSPRRILAAGLFALIGILALTMLQGQAQAKSKRHHAAKFHKHKRKRHRKPPKVKVMTRNLYLGSGLAAGLNSSSFPELCEGARTILNEVDSTNPPARMSAVGAEILKQKPDLVGLQEVAAWYTQTPGDGRPAGPPEYGVGTKATTVRYDFLKLLLNKLNKGKKRYAAVSVGNEFEFETEANLDGAPSDSPAPDCTDAESDARLLMRDVILKRLHAGVNTSKPRSGNYVHQLALNVAGFPFPVKRGWESVNARVRGSHKFVFANTHFEAFDSNATSNDVYNTHTLTTTTVSRGTVRKDQADELVGPGGAAHSKLPVVLLGDMNSNVPGVQTGDFQAFQEVLNAGFLRRSTEKPQSCCIDDNTGTLTGGSISDFDHVVDHVVVNKRRIKRLKSGVVGRAKVAAGHWPSDHAGVWSLLRLWR
jgi:endonuclease/exonuclease/phosphatase family metal-dependent hydrolase